LITTSVAAAVSERQPIEGRQGSGEVAAGQHRLPLLPVQEWMDVKARWGLTMDSAEIRARCAPHH
jgi:hypothetical protein